MNFSKLFTEYAVNDFNSKIFGKIAYKEPQLKLDPKNLNISFKNFLLLDQNAAVIFHANNLQVKWSLKNLFDPNQRIEYFKADHLVLRASKGKDSKWNFEKLVKQPSPNKLKFSFREIDAPSINLTIRDESTDKEISYDKVKIFFKTVKRKQLYTIDIEANTQALDSKELFTKSTTDLSNIIGKNYISAKGNLNLSGDQNFLLNKNNFDLVFVNLEAINIQLLNSILDFGQYNDNFHILSKSLNNSQVTLVSRISSEKNSKNNFSFNILVNNFLDFNRLSGNFLGHISQDLISVNDLDLNLDQGFVETKGTIAKWQSKDPLLNLKFKIVNLDLNKIKTELSKAKLKNPAFVYDLLATVLESNTIAGNLELNSALNNPEISLRLNPYDQVQDPRQVLGSFKYFNPNLMIKNLELPLKNSKLLMTGSFNTKQSTYDLKATSKAGDINALKNVVISLPVSAQLQQSMQEFQLDGAADLNLHIYSSKLDDFHIKGPIHINKTNLAFVDSPLMFKDLSGDLELSDSDLKITNLTGHMNNDYFETRGTLNYRDLSQVNLELASPKLDISNLDSVSFFDEVKQKYAIKAVSGSIKDVYFAYNKNQSNSDIVTHLNLDTVELRLADLDKPAKLKGLIELKNKVLKLTKLYWTFGNGSAAAIDGYANQDLTNPNFAIQAKNMPIKPLAEIINTAANYKLDFADGLINSNLILKDKEYTGTVDLNQVDFKFVDSKFSNYMFKDVKGRINFGKSLQIDNLSGQYGNSHFRNFFMKMDQYKSKDRTFSLSVNGDAYVTELSTFIPQSMKSLLTLKGYMPVIMSVTGNRQKQKYDISSSFTNLEKFTLSNWLEYQKNVPIDIKAKFMVTPQLIVSEDCKIVVSNGLAPTSKKTRIKSIFQVEQWANPEKLSYYTSFVIANKLGNADLAYIEPQIITLKTLNLSAGKGNFACDTIGDLKSRQTICDIKISKAVAKKYGIGDLSANKIDVGLLSISNKPLEVDLNFANGDWNGIPYENLDFDLKANGDYIYIDNLKAKVKDGTATAKVSFNVITTDSTFRIKGDKLPAHEIVDGIWGFGAQVPEGIVSGVFDGKTKGIMPDEMFFNLVGSANLSVKNGKLSQLKTMQRILTAVNTMSNFDINNVFQILVLYKGGLFNDIITSLDYDKGKISTKKLLLKAEEIELDLGGNLDYSNDQLLIEGQGLIPKHATSILKTIGVGEANLGNVLSLPSKLNLSASKKDKRYFEFKMMGPIIDIDKSIESLRNNFRWIEK